MSFFTVDFFFLFRLHDQVKFSSVHEYSNLFQVNCKNLFFLFFFWFCLSYCCSYFFSVVLYMNFGLFSDICFCCCCFCVLCGCFYFLFFFVVHFHFQMSTLIFDLIRLWRIIIIINDDDENTVKKNMFIQKKK